MEDVGRGILMGGGSPDKGMGGWLLEGLHATAEFPGIGTNQNVQGSSSRAPMMQASCAGVLPLLWLYMS